MADTTVVIEENETPDESEPSDTVVIDAVDAHVSAGDAEDSADDAEDAAAAAEMANAEAWYAAEAAWQSEQVSAQAAADNQQQIDALRGIADTLLATADKLAQASQANAGVLADPGPDGIPGTADDPETPPDNGHWLTKKWFGK